MVMSKKRNIEAVRNYIVFIYMNTWFQTMQYGVVSSNTSKFCAFCLSAPGWGPASTGAENAEHEKCHWGHQSWDRTSLGEVLLQPRAATKFCSISWWWISVVYWKNPYTDYMRLIIIEGVWVSVLVFFSQMISLKSFSTCMKLKKGPWRSIMRTIKNSLRESQNGRRTGPCTWNLT